MLCAAGLEETHSQGAELREVIDSLRKELMFQEVKKNEAINKLAQVSSLCVCVCVCVSFGRFAV